MAVISGQLITCEFTTRALSGGRVNADSLPTAVLKVNTVINGATVTVQNLATGEYSVSVTLPTLTLGDICEIRVIATVGGVTDNSVVWRDSRQAAAVSDLATDYALASGVNTTQIAGDASAASAHKAILNKVFIGTVTGSPTTTTFIDTAQTQPDNNWWNGRILLFGGTLAGQGTLLTGWNATTKQFTFKALTRAPIVGDPYGIV